MALCLPCLALVPAARADFFLLSPVGGGNLSAAEDLSADGTVVVGISTSNSNSTLNRGVRWTWNGSTYTGTSLGVVSGAQDSYAYGVSANGQVVVGYGNRSGFSRATRWTPATGQTEPITSPTAQFGTSLGVSDDGNTFVAYVASDGTAPYRAVRVTGTGASQVVQQLQSYNGTLNGQPYVHDFAEDVSGDGRVTVGYATLQNLSGERAVFWDATGNVTPIGAFNFFSHAYDASADGSVIVGEGTFPFMGAQGRYAWRWTAAGGVQNLGTLDPAGSSSQANAVSADGSVVAGQTHVAFGVVDAFVWTQETGTMYDLNTLLARQGISTGGWRLTAVNALAGDPVSGYTLAGTAVLGGATDGFVVTGVQLAGVPEPSPLSLLSLLAGGWFGAGLLGRRRRGTDGSTAPT